MAKKQKGEELLKDALERAKARIKLFPRTYIEVLTNYASYYGYSGLTIKNRWNVT